jgi:polyisoprenoid-binding protein YceI
VEVSDSGIQASGVATINRLDWGINYDKEKMSLSEKLKASVQNGIVGENVEISFSLNAAQ